MTRVLTEEEIAARDALRQRMMKEQETRDKVTAQQVGSKMPISEVELERCPHGIPLRKSCPKCDVLRPDEIHDSMPLGSLGG